VRCGPCLSVGGLRCYYVRVVCVCVSCVGACAVWVWGVGGKWEAVCRLWGGWGGSIVGKHISHSHHIDIVMSVNMCMTSRPLRNPKYVSCVYCRRKPVLPRRLAYSSSSPASSPRTCTLSTPYSCRKQAPAAGTKKQCDSACTYNLSTIYTTYHYLTIKSWARSLSLGSACTPRGRPLQDIRLLRGCRARINHPFIPPTPTGIAPLVARLLVRI